MSESTEHTELKGAKAAAAKPIPRLAIWMATGFGLGYLPIAPGTWGSLGGMLSFFLCERTAYVVATRPEFGFLANLTPATDFENAILLHFGLVHLAGIAIAACTGVWAARKAAVHFRHPDPGPVVIDEISGQHIAYLPAIVTTVGHRGWKYLLLGLILFRVFDIVKPWPARQAEKWPNGWGIMADDWFAGLYAALCLWAVKWLGWL